MTDYKALREAAEKASPGEWVNDVPGCVGINYREGGARTICTGPLEPGDWNMKFIALANPTTIISLLDDLAAARNDALEEAAMVAENGVMQECCQNFDLRPTGFYENGEPIDCYQECCGNPTVIPMYPNEISTAIRALKVKP